MEQNEVTLEMLSAGEEEAREVAGDEWDWMCFRSGDPRLLREFLTKLYSRMRSVENAK